MLVAHQEYVSQSLKSLPNVMFCIEKSVSDIFEAFLTFFCIENTPTCCNALSKPVIVDSESLEDDNVTLASVLLLKFRAPPV